MNQLRPEEERSRQKQAAYSFTRTIYRKYCLIYTLTRVVERQMVHMLPESVQTFNMLNGVFCVYICLWPSLLGLGKMLLGSQESSFVQLECLVYVFFIYCVPILSMQHSLQSVGTSRVLAPRTHMLLSWLFLFPICCGPMLS